MTTPLRVWSQRFAFFLLIIAAIGMIVLNRADTAFLERFRTSVVDTVTPALEAFSQPVDAIGNLGDGIRNVTALLEENERLRAEVAALRRWREEAQALKSQNETFRALLNYVPDAPTRFVSARVIADSGSAFVRSVVVNGGANNGIRKGQAAVNGDGLVGRVADVGERSARLLLITDLNSRIPVLLERTRDRAILAGDNSIKPRLVYLPSHLPIAVGDRVVTSGHGGIFPPGIPVGKVSSVRRSSDGEITGATVKPFVNWNRLELVRVLQHEPSGMVERPPDAQAAEQSQ
ncbi:MAG: rod shape-determining protein MreC [Alphaproteobacteria bacterium]|nr:rod shape-determining protein MreC [Alphaproteobacteria bacterium]